MEGTIKKGEIGKFTFGNYKIGVDFIDNKV